MLGFHLMDSFAPRSSTTCEHMYSCIYSNYYMLILSTTYPMSVASYGSSALYNYCNGGTPVGRYSVKRKHLQCSARIITWTKLINGPKIRTVGQKLTSLLLSTL